MLVLAMLGVLATAGPVDTSVRVPGTDLRFGLADSLVAARGFAPASDGAMTGRSRFFGIEGDARLAFTDGRLARAEFTLAGPAPYQRDYVQDQLAAAGYRRRCDRLTPTASDCEWTGRVRVRLKLDKDRLQAEVVPGEPAAPAVPVLPETLGVRAFLRQNAGDEAVLLDAPPCPAPGGSRADVIGRVLVVALVDVDGRVLEAAVTRGISELDAAALECVRRWRFEPRTFQGAPCRFRVEVPVTLTFE